MSTARLSPRLKASISMIVGLIVGLVTLSVTYSPAFAAPTNRNLGYETTVFNRANLWMGDYTIQAVLGFGSQAWCIDPEFDVAPKLAVNYWQNAKIGKDAINAEIANNTGFGQRQANVLTDLEAQSLAWITSMPEAQTDAMTSAAVKLVANYYFNRSWYGQPFDLTTMTGNDVKVNGSATVGDQLVFRAKQLDNYGILMATAYPMPFSVQTVSQSPSAEPGGTGFTDFAVVAANGTRVPNILFVSDTSKSSNIGGLPERFTADANGVARMTYTHTAAGAFTAAATAVVPNELVLAVPPTGSGTQRAIVPSAKFIGVESVGNVQAPTTTTTTSQPETPVTTVACVDKQITNNTVFAGTATFTVPANGCPVKITFSSYSLPGGFVTPLEEQILHDSKTATYNPGQHTVKISIPNCAWQSDLYFGDVQATLLKDIGHVNLVPGNKNQAWDFVEGIECTTTTTASTTIPVTVQSTTTTTRPATTTASPTTTTTTTTTIAAPDIAVSTVCPPANVADAKYTVKAIVKDSRSGQQYKMAFKIGPTTTNVTATFVPTASVTTAYYEAVAQIAGNGGDNVNVDVTGGAFGSSTANRKVLLPTNCNPTTTTTTAPFRPSLQPSVACPTGGSNVYAISIAINDNRDSQSYNVEIGATSVVATRTSTGYTAVLNIASNTPGVTLTATVTGGAFGTNGATTSVKLPDNCSITTQALPGVSTTTSCAATVGVPFPVSVVIADATAGQAYTVSIGGALVTATANNNSYVVNTTIAGTPGQVVAIEVSGGKFGNTPAKTSVTLGEVCPTTTTSTTPPVVPGSSTVPLTPGVVVQGETLARTGYTAGNWLAGGLMAIGGGIAMLGGLQLIERRRLAQLQA